VFGAVAERSCVFLVDTSGSMEQHMDELKKELIRLVWEQLHKHHVQFVTLFIHARTHARTQAHTHPFNGFFPGLPW